jgi:SAM-dependent methyltransferase
MFAAGEGTMLEMREGAALAPRVPADYYRCIHEVEQRHWWHRGMREVARALLGARLDRPGQSVLDAGCGTGGFLEWALATGKFERACGFDISTAAIELAGERVPAAELALGTLPEVPFAEASFDLIALSDVLQHVPEDDVQPSLLALRRALRSGGALLVRTNGACRTRRERYDWRAYDRSLLEKTLQLGGFRCERVTYANVLPSLWAEARGRAPRAPSSERHGIPTIGTRLPGAVGHALLRAEARYLRRPSRSLPFGHTLLALATVSERP